MCVCLFVCVCVCVCVSVCVCVCVWLCTYARVCVLLFDSLVAGYNCQIYLKLEGNGGEGGTCIPGGVAFVQLPPTILYIGINQFGPLHYG